MRFIDALQDKAYLCRTRAGMISVLPQWRYQAQLNKLRAVHERVIAGSARVYVEFYDDSLHATEDIFCAVGRERGHVVIEDQCLELAIRSTRIYHKEAPH